MSVDWVRGRQEVVRVVVGSELRPLAEIEAEIMSIAVARYSQSSGGKARAARELGIGRSTMYRLIKRGEP